MFLRSRYPHHRAKTLARTFSVSVSTTQRWLDGYPPTIHHFEQMYAEWGEQLIRAVFPECFRGTYREPFVRRSMPQTGMSDTASDQSDFVDQAISTHERD